MRCARFILIAIGVLLLVGCTEIKPTTRPIYTGPTESMDQVIAAINRNNTRLPTLWARHYFEASTTDKDGKTHGPFNGEGNLLYQSPAQLRVVGNKPGMDIFDIGCNSREYWCTVKPETDTHWHGTFEKLDQADVSRVPIRPDLIVQVLAIGPLEPDMLLVPVPTMRYNADADVYMFVWSAMQSDRWIAQREIWYDRQSKLPKTVILFDPDGRPVLRAYLSDHVSVDARDGSGGPMVATRYKLFFPESRSHMSFEFSAVRLKQGKKPDASSFVMPKSPGTSHVVDLDAVPPASQQAPDAKMLP